MKKVVEIMDRCAAHPDATSPMEEFDRARFTVDQYIETGKIFRQMYPRMCKHIDNHLDFLISIYDDGQHQETLQKIVTYLKNK